MITFKEFLVEAQKGNSDYYYHATLGENMPSITKHGLVGSGNTLNKNKWNYGFSKPNVVYLTDNPNLNKIYYSEIGIWSGNPSKASRSPHSIRVLRIHKSKLDPKLLKSDRNMSGEKGYYEYHDNIPPEHIDFGNSRTFGGHFDRGTDKWNKVMAKSIAGGCLPVLPKKPYREHKKKQKEAKGITND